VNDVAVRLEHVDLLDLGDGLDVHLLEGSLELLVVGAGRPVDLLLHTSGGTLATVSQALASDFFAASNSAFQFIFEARPSPMLKLPSSQALTCFNTPKPALSILI
jgi:hypothetical protein